MPNDAERLLCIIKDNTLRFTADAVHLIKVQCFRDTGGFSFPLLIESIGTFIDNRLDKNSELYRHYKPAGNRPSADLYSRAFGEKKPEHVSYYSNLFLPELIYQYIRELLTSNKHRQSYRDNAGEDVETDSIFSAKENVQPYIEEIQVLLYQKLFYDAEISCTKAMEIVDTDDEYGKVKLNYLYAVILHETFADDEKSLQLLRDALKFFKDNGLEKDTIECYLELVRVCAYLGEESLAQAYGNQYLQHYEERQSISELGGAYGNYAWLQYMLKNYDEAEMYWAKATAIGKQIVFEGGEGSHYGTYILAHCYSAQCTYFYTIGNLPDAQKNCIEALQCFATIEAKFPCVWASAGLYRKLAEIELSLGRYASGKWKVFIEEAKSFFRMFKDYVSLGACCYIQACAMHQAGDREQSRETYNEGYEEVKKSKDSHSIAHYVGQFADYHIEHKHYDDAFSAAIELLVFAEEKKISHYEIAACQRLIKICKLLNDVDKVTFYTKQLFETLDREYKRTQSRSEKNHVLQQIAEAHAKNGNVPEALEFYNMSLERFIAEKSSLYIATCELAIGDLYTRTGQQDIAFEHWSKTIDATKGKAFYELRALAQGRCGSYLANSGDYETAEFYLANANYLIAKYKLSHLKAIQDLYADVLQHLTK